MSNPLTTQGAQLPISCTFCENPAVKIEWKCLDCDLFMCAACKIKIHPKFKSADQHLVVNLKNIVPTRNSEAWSFELSDVKEYFTQLRNLTSITVTTDWSFWLVDSIYAETGAVFLFPLKKLHQIKLKEGIVKLVAIIKPKRNITIYDVAIMPCGDVLVASGEHSLQHVDKGTDKLIDSKFSVYPNKAYAIYVTKENKLLIGASSEDEENSHGMVIVMNLHGFYLQIFKCNHDGTSLFTFPFKIQQTEKGGILVLNRYDDEKQCGNLIALNSTGDVIFTYSGNKTNNTDEQFSPTGLAVSPSENIVITDVWDKLHILSSQGQLLKCFDTTNTGISGPSSIAICSDGKLCELYIGCLTKDNSKKAKLYKMLLTESKT